MSWITFELKVLLFHLITYPIKAHVHGFSKLFFMVPIMITSAVELSVIIMVACCGWSISFRVVLSASSSLTLYYNASHSASAENGMTLQMMVDMTTIDQFGRLISSFAPPM